MDDAIVWGLVISAGLALIAALRVLWILSDRDV
jgi:hypothetical protein